MKIADYKLIETYLDGTSTPEEFAVFEERLRTDPVMRLELLKESGFESQLRVLLKAAPVIAETDGTIDFEEKAAPRKAIYWRPIWLWIPAAAAAAALVAVLVSPMFTANQKPQFASHSVIAPKQNSTVVAQDTKNVAVEDVTNGVVPKVLPAYTMVASLPSHPAGGDAQPPSLMAVSPHVSVPDNRLAEVPPGNLPAIPPVVVGPVAAPHAPARLAHGPDVFGNVLAVARPDGAHPADDNQGNAGKPAAIVAVAVATGLHAVDGQIASVNGSVLLLRPTTDSKGRHVVQSGDSFLAGDVIETGVASGSTLRYADGTTVRLYGNTQLTLSQAGRNRSLYLSTGAVDLRVQPLGGGSNLTVCTSYVEARVVGTDFRVMTDSNGSWVGVKAGRVDVVRSRANGEVVVLESGYFASAARGWPPTSMNDANWRSKCQLFTGSPKYQ